ncbi:DUF4142 domain-containing protein [Deinococcus budaensis]|uniref:Putative membrane protein n=1 Tax=Deinococcus budaensis TaxID=1665626 RepID=A0A7W8LR82_9DEIO|nr:DUF4142 domain-containing protein [Deinococcus budaensis]MBB5235638.1 putative membrane protein [Deinococcus budaensis]
MPRRSALILLPLALGSCTLMAPNAGTADGLFLQAATGSNLFEIQSSQLALSKSNTAAIRAFAQQMITDHTTAQNQVNTLAAARNVPLPKVLPPELQLKITTLNTLSGAAFDAAYAREQVLGHQLSISLHQNQQTAGRDPAVVAYAAEKLPVITGHLQQAQALLTATPAAPATPSAP